MKNVGYGWWEGPWFIDWCGSEMGHDCMFLWNAWSHLISDAVLYPKRPEFSSNFQLQPVHLHYRIHERSWCILLMCELCIKHHSWHRMFLSANIYRTKNLLYMSECEVPGYWLCTHSQRRSLQAPNHMKICMLCHNLNHTWLRCGWDCIDVDITLFAQNKPMNNHLPLAESSVFNIK